MKEKHGEKKVYIYRRGKSVVEEYLKEEKRVSLPGVWVD